MTANSDWLARYNARKNGHGQPPPPPPQPQYQQPPPGYAPPQPAAYPQGYAPPPPPPPPPPVYQPLPGAPPHAPFGYDQATGVPIAPYGRDQYGNVLVQPPYAPPPPQQPYYPQQPQQPAYDARGQVMPQGYGQPPYQMAQQPWQPPVEIDPNTGDPVVRAMDAAAAFKGREGVKNAEACPECGGVMFQPIASAEGRKLNTNTGQFAYAAGHCTNCGYNSLAHPGAATMAIAGGTAGVGVKVVGQARSAPGAGSIMQTAHQHGLPNLFAPKE